MSGTVAVVLRSSCSPFRITGAATPAVAALRLCSNWFSAAISAGFVEVDLMVSASPVVPRLKLPRSSATFL